MVGHLRRQVDAHLPRRRGGGPGGRARSAPSRVTPSNLHIGLKRVGAPNVDAFSGVLDEVVLYDRGLNASEVRQLAAGAGAALSRSSPRRRREQNQTSRRKTGEATWPANPPELDDVTLARAKSGDRAAQAALLEHYEPRVVGMLSWMLGYEEPQLEDLAQETFFRVLRALPGFHTRSSGRLGTWILTIATRLALDQVRRDPANPEATPGWWPRCRSGCPVPIRTWSAARSPARSWRPSRRCGPVSSRPSCCARCTGSATRRSRRARHRDRNGKVPALARAERPAARAGRAARRVRPEARRPRRVAMNAMRHAGSTVAHRCSAAGLLLAAGGLSLERRRRGREPAAAGPPRVGRRRRPARRSAARPSRRARPRRPPPPAPPRCGAPASSCAATTSQRLGANLDETILAPAAITPGEFGKLYCRPVDGEIYGQILYVPNLDLGARGRRNACFVVTMKNRVYAFDADSEQEPALWEKSYVDEAAAVTPVPARDVGRACGVYRDISTSIGILGTPVIDPASSTMYFVTRSKEGAGADIQYLQRLHAVSLLDGSARAGSPVVIEGSLPGTGANAVDGRVRFNPLTNNQRAALMLHDGVVYIAWSSHCDQGPYHGWVLGYDATSLAQVVAYNTTPNGRNGGIWMSGAAPAVDEQGFIYLLTGNGDADLGPEGGPNRGHSFLKLRRQGGDSAARRLVHPLQLRVLEAEDRDLGSTGVVLIPGTNIVMGGSKEGKLYLVDRTNMGKHRTTDDSQILQTVALTGAAPGPHPRQPRLLEEPGGRVPLRHGRGGLPQAVPHRGRPAAAAQDERLPRAHRPARAQHVHDAGRHPHPDRRRRQARQRHPVGHPQRQQGRQQRGGARACSAPSTPATSARSSGTARPTPPATGSATSPSSTPPPSTTARSTSPPSPTATASTATSVD